MPEAARCYTIISCLWHFGYRDQWGQGPPETFYQIGEAKPPPSLLLAPVRGGGQKGSRVGDPGRALTASKSVELFVPAQLCCAIARSAMHKPTRSVGSEMGVSRLARNYIVSTNTTIRGYKKGTPSGECRFRGGPQTQNLSGAQRFPGGHQAPPRKVTPRLPRKPQTPTSRWFGQTPPNRRW